MHDPCIFDSAARDKYYPDRRLGFKPRGEVPLECETRPADSSTPSRREAYYPHDIKLRRYYAFAACARSSAEDAFLRPAVTIFRMRSSELLFPSSDTQASSV